MFCHFGSESGKRLKGSGMYRFEAKRIKKDSKYVILNDLQNDFIRFLALFDFKHQNSKFLLNKYPKNK